MRLTVGKQLGLTFSVVIFLMLSSTLIMRSYLQDVKTITNKAGQESIPLALLTANMRFDAVNVQQFFTDASATGNADSLKEAEDFAESFLKNTESAKQIYSKRDDSVALGEIAGLEKSFNSMHTLGKKMAQTYIDDGRDAGNTLMKSFDIATEDLSNRLDKISRTHTYEATTQIQSLDATLGLGLTIQWVLLALSAILCGGVGITFTRLLRRQLGAEPADLEAAANDIATGNFMLESKCAQTSRGVHKALCLMTSHLREAMNAAKTKQQEAESNAEQAEKQRHETEQKEIRLHELLDGMSAASAKAQKTSKQMFSSITDLRSNMTSVTENVDTQRSRMSATTDAMEQMKEAILEIAHNTGNAARSADQSRTNAMDGAKGVREAVAATELVKDRILNLKETMA